MISERKIAHDILTKISKDKSYSNLELDKHLKGVDSRSRGFITNLVYGTISNRTRIDYIISAYSSVPVNKISPDVLEILRMGIYQILYTDKIPLYAIVNESVELSRLKSVKGFINGMLRNIARNSKPVNYPKDFAEFLSVYYSCPKWICDMWIKTYGKKQAEDLIKSTNNPPPLCARVNTLKISVSDFCEKYDAKKDELTDCGVIFDNSLNISDDEGHKNGLFYIQDTASQLPCEVLAPTENDVVFDMCAAPGGKTTYLAQIMQNKGKIYAFDIHPHKIKLIENTASRLGLENITAQVKDGSALDENLVGRADKILLDAPCSGLGIIRRKPEIKFDKTPDDIKSIVKLQADMLETASKYLKCGGHMVYSTCTINEDENEKQIQNFLENHKNFTLQSIRTNNVKSDSGLVQLLPSVHGCDGFFVANLIKTEEEA